MLKAIARLNAYTRGQAEGSRRTYPPISSPSTRSCTAPSFQGIPAEELGFTALKAPHETTPAPLPDIEAETRRYPWWGPKLPGVDDESAEDEGSADAEESIDGSASDDDESCSEDEGGSDDGNASADVGEDAAIAERGA